jgi:hypothetical protein
MNRDPAGTAERTELSGDGNHRQLAIVLELEPAELLRVSGRANT